MRSIVLAFAVLMPVLDNANAQDVLSTLEFPKSSRQLHGDAPPPNLKKQQGGLDMSSAASIAEPSTTLGVISSNERYGDAAPAMKSRSVTRPRAFFGSN